MQIKVIKKFNIELSEDEVKSFLEMCDDIHEGKPYDSTLLYQMEEALCSYMNVN